MLDGAEWVAECKRGMKPLSLRPVINGGTCLIAPLLGLDLLLWSSLESMDTRLGKEDTPELKVAVRQSVAL